MPPITEVELSELFRKMRIYRFFFWIYMGSAILYLFAVVGMGSSVPASHLPLADAALVYGVLCCLAVFLAKWLSFRPAALRGRGIVGLKAMTSHIFLTLLFLLAAGESLGMAALTAASMGGRPPWKLAMLCLWQIAVGVVLTPDRAHWDRILTRWESTLTSGGTDETL